MALKIEEYIEKVNGLMVKQLKTAFDIPVFENRVTESEEKNLRKGKKLQPFFIYRTGDIRAPEGGNQKGLSQDVAIVYISEMVPDLDVKALKIIAALDNKNTYHFQRATKAQARKGDTDGFVDVIEFTFTRVLKYGC